MLVPAIVTMLRGEPRNFYLCTKNGGASLFSETTSTALVESIGIALRHEARNALGTLMKLLR